MSPKDDHRRRHLLKNIPTTLLKDSFGGNPKIKLKSEPLGSAILIDRPRFAIAIGIAMAVIMFLVLPAIAINTMSNEINDELLLEDKITEGIRCLILFTVGVMPLILLMGGAGLVIAHQCAANSRIIVDFKDQSITFLSLSIRGYYTTRYVLFREIVALQILFIHRHDNPNYYQVNMITSDASRTRYVLYMNFRLEMCQHMATQVSEAIGCPVIQQIDKGR